jgi:hypothetical protein
VSLRIGVINLLSLVMSSNASICCEEEAPIVVSTDARSRAPSRDDDVDANPRNASSVGRRKRQKTARDVRASTEAEALLAASSLSLTTSKVELAVEAAGGVVDVDQTDLQSLDAESQMVAAVDRAEKAERSWTDLQTQWGSPNAQAPPQVPAPPKVPTPPQAKVGKRGPPKDSDPKGPRKDSATNGPRQDPTPAKPALATASSLDSSEPPARPVSNFVSPAPTANEMYALMTAYMATMRPQAPAEPGTAVGEDSKALIPWIMVSPLRDLSQYLDV